MNNIYKGKSRISGTGIFAGKDYKIGDYVCRLKGRQIVWKYNEKTDRNKCANWFGIAKDLWVDPDFPLVCINHSCDPNLGIKGRIMFYALKNIKKGDELTFDYSISEEEIEWKMKCRCGSKKCRKYVTAIQQIPKKVFISYLPFIPTYFQKVYKRYNRV